MSCSYIDQEYSFYNEIVCSSLSLSLSDLHFQWDHFLIYSLRLHLHLSFVQFFRETFGCLSHQNPSEGDRRGYELWKYYSDVISSYTRLVQLVQCIKYGGGSHLPRYFFFLLPTRLCYLSWGSTLWGSWLLKVFLRWLSSSDFLSMCLWVFIYPRILNHPRTEPKAPRHARITHSHNSGAIYISLDY